MKTVTISWEGIDVNELLGQARHEAILLRAADGTEFMLTAVEDCDEELVRTRQKAKLRSGKRSGKGTGLESRNNTGIRMRGRTS